MKNNIVSFGQAKELKELGWNKPTKARYNKYWTLGWKLDILEYSEIELVREYLHAPTVEEYNEFKEAIKNGK